MAGYEKCKVNPEDEKFVEKFEGLHPDFKKDLFLEEVTKEQVYRYIVFTFDIESPYVIKFKDWAQRRRATAKAARFPKSGTSYSKEAETIILGKNRNVNQLFIRYLFLQNDVDFLRYQSYQFLYFKQIRASMEADYDNPGHYDKLKKNIDVLASELKSLEGMIFHGNESKELKKSLYDFASKISLDFKPEDRALKLENGEIVVDESPYPDDYQPEEMRFIGDE